LAVHCVRRLLAGLLAGGEVVLVSSAAFALELLAIVLLGVVYMQ
jgi:hypothetical protein